MTLPYSDAESSPATERGHKQKIAMKARQSKEIEEATRRALDLDGRRGGLVMVGGSLLATRSLLKQDAKQFCHVRSSV